MKHVLNVLFVIFTIYDSIGQLEDTIEFISTKYLQLDGPNLLIPIDEYDTYLLDSFGYRIKKIDGNLYRWNNNDKKQIHCSGQIQIYKFVDSIKTKIYCLACIIDNKVSEINACTNLFSYKLKN